MGPRRLRNSRNRELVPFHVNPAAAEDYAFCLQTQSLLDGMITTEFDFSAGAQNAMPRQTK